MKAKYLTCILTLSIIISQPAIASLLNVDFESGALGSHPIKVGFAATGETANDYWNFYTRSNPDGSWRSSGLLNNLTYASGGASGVDLTVNNGAGYWSNGSSDPMYDGYIYPLPNGPGLTVTVSKLSPGTYNFYLYSHDSTFNLNVNGSDLGTKRCFNLPVVDPPLWREGLHYALFGNVQIADSEAIAVVSVGSGDADSAGIISGMQIEMVPEPSCTVLLCVGGLMIVYRAHRNLRNDS